MPSQCEGKCGTITNMTNTNMYLLHSSERPRWCALVPNSVHCICTLVITGYGVLGCRGLTCSDKERKTQKGNLMSPNNLIVVFGMWEEAWVFVENPRRHEETHTERPGLRIKSRPSCLEATMLTAIFQLDPFCVSGCSIQHLQWVDVIRQALAETCAVDAEHRFFY